MKAKTIENEQLTKLNKTLQMKTLNEKFKQMYITKMSSKDEKEQSTMTITNESDEISENEPQTKPMILTIKQEDGKVIEKIMLNENDNTTVSKVLLYNGNLEFISNRQTIILPKGKKLTFELL